MRRPLPTLLLVLIAAGGAPAREDSGERGRYDGRRLRAVAAGLEFLEQAQNRDGSFGKTETGVVGVTSLCILAFFAAGHQEGRGPYGETVRRGIDYLIARSLPPSEKNPSVSTVPPYPPGYIFALRDADSRMHGHCYAAQALLLAYGSGRQGDPRTQQLRAKIVAAVEVIQRAQTITGGWGYSPTPDASHEGSITVVAVQALRLAVDAGFVVDRELPRMGLNYLHDSQKSDGSFKYALQHDKSTAALTAAAISALHGFGEYYSEPVKRGLAFLREAYARPDDLEWYYYANYYAAQAFYRAGGEGWRHWNETVVPHILDRQAPALAGEAGAWDDGMRNDAPRAHGRAFATAMSCLALSVADGLLPLFQK
ncbi:MAG: hypothetical protein ACT4PV_00530 [Planctomycetaceae bacterium]